MIRPFSSMLTAAPLAVILMRRASHSARLTSLARGFSMEWHSPQEDSSAAFPFLIRSTTGSSARAAENVERNVPAAAMTTHDSIFISFTSI